MDGLEKSAAGAPERPKTEIVALDFGASGIKAARFRRQREKFVLVAADILPPADLSAPAVGPMDLAVPLKAHYAALCLNGPRSHVRLLDLPVTPGVKIEDQIQQQLNLAGDYRLGHCPLPARGAKGIVRTVVAALPQDQTAALLSRFATGAPAPSSLEHSSLASLNGFQAGPGAQHHEEMVGLLDAGARSIHLFLLRQGYPVLIRRFDTGGAAVVERIQTQFNLDAETAANVLTTGAIDLSAVYRDVLASVFKQLGISRDFVERRENCRVARIYVTGGLSASAFWAQTVGEAMGCACAAWNPLEGIASDGGAFPERLRGQETRFAAAVGAAIGGMSPA